MVMPSFPSAHLVVRQARLTLGPLQVIFNVMLGLEDASEFRERRVHRRECQCVIVLPRAVLLSLAKRHQKFPRVRWLSFGTRLHELANRLDHNGAFLAIADVDCLPVVFRQRGAQPIHTPERDLRMPAATIVW